jgi:hypothetical protein
MSPVQQRQVRQKSAIEKRLARLAGFNSLPETYRILQTIA